LGTWSIIIGAALWKIYLDRDKDNWFGKCYRNFYRNFYPNINPKYIYIILSLLAILMGVIVLLFGVRKTMVGVP